MNTHSKSSARYDYLVKALEGDATKGIAPVKQGGRNAEFSQKLHRQVQLPPIILK